MWSEVMHKNAHCAVAYDCMPTSTSFNVFKVFFRGMKATVNHEPVLLIPTPSHWVRDLKEGAEILGMVESFRATVPCMFFTTASPNEFSDVDLEYPSRTEASMEHVSLS
jgi:hypothetical protein